MTLAQQQQLDHALDLLTPRSHEYPDVQRSFRSLKQQIKQTSVNWNRSFGWVTAVAACSLFLFVVGRPGLQPGSHLTNKSLMPSHVQKRTPPGMLVRKGQKNQQLALQVVRLSAKPMEGVVVPSGQAVLQADTLAIRYRLHGRGGYATLLWHRRGEPMAVLFQSGRFWSGNRLIPVQRDNLLLKFPLKSESPGFISLILVQSNHPLTRKQLQFLRRQHRTSKSRSWHELLQTTLKKDLVGAIVTTLQIKK